MILSRSRPYPGKAAPRKRAKRSRTSAYVRLPALLRGHEAALVLGLLVLVIFVWLTPRYVNHDGAERLAKLMLQGHLSFPERLGWMEMYPRDGRWYLAYSPMVSLVLVPVVVLFPWLGQSLACTLMFFGTAVLLYLFLREFPSTKKIAAPAMVLYCFGTTVVHCVYNASVWALMHAEGNFFLMLALYLVLIRKRPWLAGLSFGIAATCRLALLPSALGLALLFWDSKGKLLDGPKRWRPLLLFAGFAAIPVLVNMAFNHGMTGSPFLSPYHLTFQFWEIKGPAFSFRYFWERFVLYTVVPPTFQATYPFVRFPLTGNAMWMLSPFLLGAIPACFRVKPRLLSLFVGFAAIFLTFQCYYFTGYVQLGTRYIIDTFPYLVPLALLGLRPDTKWGFRAFVILGSSSVFIVGYAVYTLRFVP